MFNDLTNNSPAGGSNPTNSPAPGPSPVPSPGSFSSAAAPRKEVDDIFSETDQIETQGVFSQSRPQIEARTVGLGAATNLDDDLPKPSGSQAFKKIAIALIILVILGAGAYFAYSKFFSQATPVNYTPETAPVTVQPETAAPVVAEPSPTASTTPEITASTSPDINASSTEPVVLVASSTTDLSNIDSDHDGRTDRCRRNSIGDQPKFNRYR
ncbi:MAG: hypothetical protein NTX66_03295 [Candidatus Falkowbacteria bacterium]|nr:hypothetical protein [Candidatus Falkowbacteria bacterium]